MTALIFLLTFPARLCRELNRGVDYTPERSDMWQDFKDAVARASRKQKSIEQEKAEFKRLVEGFGHRRGDKRNVFTGRARADDH